MSKRIILLILFFFTSTIVFAQHGAMEHKNFSKELLENLNLTPQQKKEIIKIMRKNKSRIKEINQKIFYLRKENMKILSNYPPNKEEFMKNQEKISEFLKEIHLIRMKGYIEIISVLNEDQHRKFVSLMLDEDIPPPPLSE